MSLDLITLVIALVSLVCAAEAYLHVSRGWAQVEQRDKEQASARQRRDTRAKGAIESAARIQDAIEILSAAGLLESVGVAGPRPPYALPQALDKTPTNRDDDSDETAIAFHPNKKRMSERPLGEAGMLLDAEDEEEDTLTFTGGSLPPTSSQSGVQR